MHFYHEFLKGILEVYFLSGLKQIRVLFYQRLVQPIALYHRVFQGISELELQSTIKKADAKWTMHMNYYKQTVVNSCALREECHAGGNSVWFMSVVFSWCSFFDEIVVFPSSYLYTEFKEAFCDLLNHNLVFPDHFIGKVVFSLQMQNITNIAGVPEIKFALVQPDLISVLISTGPMKLGRVKFQVINESNHNFLFSFCHFPLPYQ